MDINSKIYVAGHNGLVGSALLRQLHLQNYKNLVTRTRKELDLTNQADVRSFFEKEAPDVVFLAAAKVGGIYANNTYPAEFIYQNVTIQTNIIHESWRIGVKNLLFLGSSCIYPRDCPQPINEEYLLTGPLESTNRAYALAKIAGIEMCRSYNQQYKMRNICVMPTNLYGPNDNYDLNSSHVIPALIRKMHDAKINSNEIVSLWGTGKPRREFLFSDDLATACIYLMKLRDSNKLELNSETPPLFNVGSGEDLEIIELARLIKTEVGYEGQIEWDNTKPDGTKQKLLNISSIKRLGWEPKIGLKEGIKKAYLDFKNTY